MRTGCYLRRSLLEPLDELTHPFVNAASPQWRFNISDGAIVLDARFDRRSRLDEMRPGRPAGRGAKLLGVVPQVASSVAYGGMDDGTFGYGCVVPGGNQGAEAGGAGHDAGAGAPAKCQ